MVQFSTLAHMSPMIEASSEALHGMTTNSCGSHDVALAHAPRNHVADLSDLGFCIARVPVLFAARHFVGVLARWLKACASALVLSVARIVGNRTAKQVVGVDANRIIAMVTNLKAARNRLLVMNHPRDAMRSACIAGNPEPSVPEFSRGSGLPRPALFGTKWSVFGAESRNVVWLNFVNVHSQRIA